MHKKSIEAVKRKNEMEWMSVPGVEGVGITEEKNKKVIVVYISEKTSDIQKQIPQEIEGYKIILKLTGEFKAF